MEGGSSANSVKSFRDLRVWQSAYQLSLKIYKLCSLFPKSEQYGLASQMQRAAVSVCSNIAEGFGRRGHKEKDQFYAMANGSLTELENQLLIAKGIGYTGLTIESLPRLNYFVRLKPIFLSSMCLRVPLRQIKLVLTRPKLAQIETRFCVSPVYNRGKFW